MTVGVGSYDDLQPEPARPIDRNPSIPCAECGEQHNWQDYWKPIVEDGRIDDPHEEPWLCDDCHREKSRLERRRSENHQLNEVVRDA